MRVQLHDRFETCSNNIYFMSMQLSLQFGASSRALFVNLSCPTWRRALNLRTRVVEDEFATKHFVAFYLKTIFCKILSTAIAVTGLRKSEERMYLFHFISIFIFLTRRKATEA